MMTECQLRIMTAALLRGTVGRLAHGMGAEALPACRIKPQTNRDQMTRLALYFLLSGLTVAAGVLAVDSAQQVAEQIKVRQIAQCVTVHKVAH